MPQRIQLRRGTASEWNLANPVLAAGELGVEDGLGSVKIKVGDGTSTWDELGYFAADVASALTAADVAFVPVGTIGSTNLQAALAEVASEGLAALSAESANRISDDSDEALARIAGDAAVAADLAALEAALPDTYVQIPAGIADGEVPTWDADTETWVAGTGGFDPTVPVVLQFGGGLLTATIAGITTANPAVVTTVEPHGLATGNDVGIRGVLGATQANANWAVTVLSPTTFSIPFNVTGTYTSGGTVTLLAITTANLGQIWPTDEDLGLFSWEFWSCLLDDTITGYLFSEGNGGAHGLLFDGIAGNISTTGLDVVSFGGGYSPQLGEWMHSRCLWTGSHIIGQVNGIVVFIKPFAGPRRAQQGTGYIGGSDHSNFTGKIAGERAWEGSCPLFNQAGHGLVFIPERVFSPRAPLGSPSTTPAQIVHSYLGTPSARLIPDEGDGFDGQLHPAVLQGVGNGVSPFLQPPPGPVWVQDDTAPFALASEPARTRVYPTAAPAPAGVKIWDGGGGADSLPAFTSATAGGVVQTSPGSTSGGTLGVQAWTVENPATPWGRFDGGLVCFAASPGTSVLYVTGDSGDFDLRVDRANAVGYGVALPTLDPTFDQSSDMGLVFRRQNATNYLKTLVYHDQYGNNVIQLYSVVAGVETLIESWPLPNYTWTTQRITGSGPTITGYVDGTAIGDAPVSALQTAVGYGLLGGGGTAIRAKNFRLA